MNSTTDRSIATDDVSYGGIESERPQLNRFSRKHRNWQLRLLLCCFVCLRRQFPERRSSARSPAPVPGDYVYLYSSMTTLDVRATLQCGQQVVSHRPLRSLFRRPHRQRRNRLRPLDSLLLVKDRSRSKAGLLLQPRHPKERKPRTTNPSSRRGSSERSGLGPISRFAR